MMEPITWEVKKVIDKRQNPTTGELEYLLDWKNWDGPPTWEPLVNCSCTKLIKRYEQQQVAAQHARRSNPMSRPPRGRPRKGPLSSANRSGCKEVILLDTSSSSTSQSSSSRSPSRSTSSSSSDSDPSDNRLKQQQNFATPAPAPAPVSASLSVVAAAAAAATPTTAISGRPLTRSRSLGPRAKSPNPQDCCDSSCSEADEERDFDVQIKGRKLLLKEIVGAVKGDEIILIVKWHGIANLEKVPLQILRKFYSQDILNFLLSRISWAH